MTSTGLIRDFTDEEARRALVLKWGTQDPDVLPAWVAEMDYALAPPVAEALQRAAAQGITGYPAHSSGGPLGAALAGFAARHFDWPVDPEQVLATVDVTAGVRIALEALSDHGPMVLPTPAYHPQFGIAGLSGRETWELPLDPDAGQATLDLDRLDDLFSRGARTLLLTQPHNPLGHVYTRAELEAIRDVVVRHGARVISDEVHAPLVLPGASHVPYLALEGTADHAVTVTAASKAFNTPGLRCAQLVTADPAARDRLLAEPMCRNNSWSPLGEVAAVAAYTEGDEWLASLVERLDRQRGLLTSQLRQQLPLARMRPLEATYLAWLDLRGYGHDDPATLALDKGRLHVEAGDRYQPGLTGHVRVNIATSPERLVEIVRRLAVTVDA
ncbi:MalY/PatB family protein [Nocardioides sp.]|uniref:MalY/PatB family protein n=1 Tax=Nocardioides sp. TaxID=35761 RepID=UPI002ED4CF70